MDIIQIIQKYCSNIMNKEIDLDILIKAFMYA